MLIFAFAISRFICTLACEEVPVLSCLATEQIETVNKMVEAGKMKNCWVEINKNMITNPGIQFISVLGSKHYLRCT